MDQEPQFATPSIDSSERERTLIVFAPPAGAKASEWGTVIKSLTNRLDPSQYEWLVHETRVKTSIAESAVDLRARVDQQFLLSGPYLAVILVGISIGGIVVRHAYLQSWGTYANIPLSSTRWGHLVSRIVLVASPNRGIGLDPFPALLRGSIRSVLKFIPTTRYLVDLLTGSDFLTDLKIRWIERFSLRSYPNVPLVVHVLPALSGFVTRASMIDESQFPGAIYLDVPGMNAEQMQIPKRYLEESGLFGLLHSAVFSDRLQPTLNRSNSEDAERVVFVLHGIRADNTGWVSQISNKLKGTSKTIEVVTATYGYYSLLRFPFALARRRNVRWFQDLYSYNFARYPKAKFSFIGHSYGTYILGQSMARVPAMRFERILLVGSVLPREYRWSDRIDAGQVQEIRNDRSASDIPVKVLCSALHAFGRDVGTGGVDGFDEGRCREVFFYKGNHSRPLDRDNLGNLADYILTGKLTKPSELVQEISPVLGIVARLAPALAIVIVCAMLCTFPGVWWVYVKHGLAAAISAVLAIVVIVVVLDAV